MELEGSPSIEVFIDEYSQTLTGVNLAVTLSVPWDWSACDIPADFAVGGSGSGGGGAGGGGIVLKTNGVLNGSQSILDLVEGTNVTITDNGSGVVTISASGGGGGGSVTSVGLSAPSAFTVTGSPITTSGTLALSGAGTSADYIDGAGDLQTFPTIPTLTSELTNDSAFITIGDVPPQVNSDWAAVSGVDEILNKPTLAAVATSGDYNDLSNLPTIPTATVTSVALTMPAAFTVGGSPVTTAGTLGVTGAGVASQYIRGDGTLANFPTGGGGGASVNYYLNGSVSQGTIGGATFQQLNKTAVIGAGTDFIRTNAAGNGYIAQFITDANDPAQLLIPSGNWHFETFFSASSNGGNPSFYIELYKYNGATLTLIASNSANPEGITNGTVIDLYTSVISVPATVLTATERIAIRIYVVTSGRTLTLHTEGPHLSEITTTFSTGITALNGLTDQVQSLTTGTAGTDFAITSAGSVHTFNLPTASALNRGALSSADWATFNNRKDTFTIRVAVGPFAPADNITYYFGEQGLTATQIATIWDAIIPFDCILVAASIYAGNTAGVATAEASTVNFRVNNTTDTLLSNAVIFGGAVPVGNAYSITGLSTNLLAGNTFVIKWTTPAWVTNPTSAQLLITLFFERI